jgi:RimJ/RimL family protein N-acetyltransferase
LTAAALVGKSCTLEIFDPSYLPRMRAYLADPEVARSLAGAESATFAGLIGWLGGCTAGDGAHVFSILRHESTRGGEPEFVGISVLRPVAGSALASAVSGTIIGEKTCWGQGIGTEAKRLQLGFAFRELGLDRVLASIVRGNERIRRLLERAGYVELPTRPDGIPRGDTNHERRFYAVTRDQWVRARAL